MRLKGSAEVLEHRRHRALALLDEGRSLNEVARLVGSAPSSVMRWRDARRRGGDQALKVRFSPGRPTKLTKRQRSSLVRRLLRGAMAYGHSTELWTTRRIADLIKQEFGIDYHPDHVGRLMHGLGWTHQKPERRAQERNEAAIVRWKEVNWSRVKKTLPGWVPISSSSTNRASS